MTSRKELNDFLSELTQLCRKHGLYVEVQSNDAWIGDSENKTIADSLFYDYEAQEYSANLVVKENEQK